MNLSQIALQTILSPCQDYFPYSVALIILKVNVMLVIAHHFIQNPDAFWTIVQQQTASIPANLKLHSVFPSKDLKTSTCVWEAASAQEVQAFLDTTLGHVAKNVCYEVKEEMAIGLPQKAMVAAMS